MLFTKRLRAGVRRGEIKCSVRIWQRPRVKVGGRYPMQAGQIEVDSIERLELGDITAELARESGFNGVVDLLKTAKHGAGTNVYLVRFHYVSSQSSTSTGRRTANLFLAKSRAATGSVRGSPSSWSACRKARRTRSVLI